MSTKPAQTDRLSAGRLIPCTDEIRRCIDSSGEEGYDFVVAHISYPWCCLDVENLPDKLPQISRPDLILRSSDWNRLIVAKISPWIDVDSENKKLRLLSQKALQEELSYYSYLCVPAILLELKRPRQPNLARMINDFLESTSGPVVWAVVPTTIEKSGVSNGVSSGESGVNGSLDDQESCSSFNLESEAETDTWYWFQRFRTACDNKLRLGAVLKLTSDLPEDPERLKRWMGEPLKAFTVDTSIFLTNDKRFPVLTKGHQAYIKQLFTLKIQAVVTGRALHVRPKVGKNSDDDPESISATSSKHCLYFSYLHHLFKNKPSLDTVSEWALGYEDFLQIPLQPLGDNLESQIYETFEKDPVKYVEYKNAVADAILFKKSLLTDDHQGSNFVPVIMVLGAGRGPLVSATIEALSSCSVNGKVYAVEKNPNAIVTLNFLNRTKWDSQVTVVFSDMRDFRPSDENKADIVVSELLGSFGDNELSPECLDGALHLMKPDCISIPCNYTSYIAPIHSPKLHQTVRQQALREQQIMAAFETSYVVRIHNHYLPAEPQPLFHFEHPNFELSSNDRFKELTFSAKESCDLSGLVGFFNAELFTGSTLNILPNRHTPGLFSWFPIYFPFKDPIFVKKGEKIVINFWRASNARQVWYEWCMVKPIQTPIMNCNGRSSAIRKI